MTDQHHQQQQTDREVLDAVREEYAKARADPGNAGRAAFAVLLETGSMNPIHRQHVKILDIAAQCLERDHNVKAVLGVLSPSCDFYVRSKLRAEAIPFRDRIAMARLAADEHCRTGAGAASSTALRIVASEWEGRQPSFVDFPDVRERLQDEVKRVVRGPTVKVLFVCGIDHFERCGLAYGHVPCVAVQRPPYTTREVSNLQRDVYVINAGAVEGAADVSSTEMRSRRTKHEPIDDLTYSSVAAYLHKIAWI
jgi:nicotinic acid mononucleotide adenylyltransferase